MVVYRKIKQWKILRPSSKTWSHSLQQVFIYERLQLKWFHWENFGVLNRWWHCYQDPYGSKRHFEFHSQHHWLVLDQEGLFEFTGKGSILQSTTHWGFMGVLLQWMSQGICGAEWVRKSSCLSSYSMFNHQFLCSLPFPFPRLSICHFRNEQETGAEMRPAIVSGIVSGDAPVSYWPFFPCPRSLCER